MKNFIINHKLIFIFLGICFILLVSPKSSYCSVSDDFIVWLESNKTELGTLLEASPNVQDYIIINNAWDNKSVLFYTSGTNNKFYFTHISDSKKLLCCSNDLGNNMYTYYIFNNDGDSNFIMPILDYFEDPYYMTNVIQNWQSDYSNILYNSSTVYYDGTEKVLIEKKKLPLVTGTLAPILEKVEMKGKTMTEILTLVPIMIALLVSYLALRKGLAFIMTLRKT